MSTKIWRAIVDELTEWEEIGSVGKSIVYRDHNGFMAVGAESVVKLREMPPEDQDVLRALVRKYKSSKFNIVCDASGTPDRVEIYRQLI